MTAQLHSFLAETSTRDIWSSHQSKQGMCELGQPELGKETSSETPERHDWKLGGNATVKTWRQGGNQIYWNSDCHRQGNVRQEKRKHQSGSCTRRDTSSKHRRSGEKYTIFHTNINFSCAKTKRIKTLYLLITSLRGLLITVIITSYLKYLFLNLQNSVDALTHQNHFMNISLNTRKMYFPAVTCKLHGTKLNINIANYKMSDLLIFTSIELLHIKEMIVHP